MHLTTLIFVPRKKEVCFLVCIFYFAICSLLLFFCIICPSFVHLHLQISIHAPTALYICFAIYIYTPFFCYCTHMFSACNTSPITFTHTFTLHLYMQPTVLYILDTLYDNTRSHYAHIHYRDIIPFCIYIAHNLTLHVYTFTRMVMIFSRTFSIVSEPYVNMQRVHKAHRNQGH